MTRQQLENIIREFKVKKFTVKQEYIGAILIDIIFEDMQWFEFLRRKRIKNCINHLEKIQPVYIIFNYYFKWKGIK